MAAEPRIESVTGTIALTDGTTSEFSIGEDGVWQQWGATTERLGRTVDTLETMARGLLGEDLLTSASDDEEDEDD